jgi:hypothetical protein
MSTSQTLTSPRFEPLVSPVELRYVARAGLLPELSRQTYDSFYKALRETVLNSVDAGATRVDIDLSQVSTNLELLVADDGVGMSRDEFCDHFMSLGGSTKYGDGSQFGRIGIGSLALLHYARAATIETKRAGASEMTVARLEHPWSLDAGQRRTQLADMSAGRAVQQPYDGPSEDHFTRVRLHGVSDAVAEVERDPSAFYRLLDDLRRVLPLTWSDSHIAESLSRHAPDLANLLLDHMEKWSIPVYVSSSWDREVRLTRRSFGDEPSGTEAWAGKIHPIHKTLRVPGTGSSRRITLAGFLLSQRRAFTAWSGITARVQNVAIEERTFFDVTSDPGFRKYVTGEVFFLGDVDRERLINIDRASFNRECADYRVAQRFMGADIVAFKAKSVQRPQRRKVTVRRLIEEYRDDISRIVRVTEQLNDGPRCNGRRGLPSSRNGRISRSDRACLVDALRDLGAEVGNSSELGSVGYRVETRPDDERIYVYLSEALVAPRTRVLDAEYAICFAEGRPTDPPVVIKNRPREIVFNSAHPANLDARGRGKWHLSLALELAYLMAQGSGTNDLYDRMLAFVAAV